MSKKKNLFKRLFFSSNQEDELQLEELLTCIVINDIEGLKKLLDKGVPLNNRDGLDRLPLHLAIQKDRIEIIKILAFRGADVQLCNDQKESPLLLSLKYGNLDSARELLRLGADIYAKNLQNKTIEDLAKETNNQPFLQIIEEYKMHRYDQKKIKNQNDSLKFAVADKEYTDLLDKAAKRETEIELHQLSSKQKAIQEKISKEKEDRLKKIEADYEKRIKASRELAQQKIIGTDDSPNLKNPIDPLKELSIIKLKKKLGISKKTHEEALVYCILKNLDQEVKVLLSAELSLEKVDNNSLCTPVAAAVEKGNVDLLTSLLQHGAQPNSVFKGNSILYTAVDKEKIALVKTLLDHGANPNLVIDKFSCLELAISKNNEQICRLLLENGAAVNYHYDQSSPIVALIKSSHCNLLPLLVEYQVNLNCTKTGRTPINWCMVYKKPAIFKKLIAQGADINQGRSEGDALISQAIRIGKTDFVKLILAANADINIIDKFGKTPLQLAVTDNEVKMVKLLIDAGADIQQKDENGKTPLDIARTSRKREDIIRLLEQAGE